MNLKNILKLLIYLSVIFLLLYLQRHGLLKIPRIYSPFALFISIIFLFMGFLIDAWGWQIVINQNEKNIGYKIALISNGLYIFTKYLPGKIWIIFGRAGYLKEHTKWSLAELGGLSFFYQIIVLTTGMIIGVIGIIKIGFDVYYVLIAIIFIVASLILLFTGIVDKVISWGSKRLLGINYNLVSIPIIKVFRVLVVSFICWISWSIGFYFFVMAVTPDINLTPAIGMGFPFATVWGVVAIFAPGGLGVREGILTGYLKLTSLNLELATTISVFSRIWFLTGELFLFISALTLKSLKK